MAINLSKGDTISFDKAEAAAGIKAENGWTAEGKDYDLKALVLYRDGSQTYIGAANDDEVLVDRTGAVRHHGDVKRPGDLETIEISYHPDIARVALSSYSALENGTGSFQEYGVFVRASSQTRTVQISAENASASSSSYTCLFAEVVFGEDGTMDLVGREDYSRSDPPSEHRVGYVRAGGGLFRKAKGDFEIRMDAGPVGRTK